jgi:hypothetical protein
MMVTFNPFRVGAAAFVLLTLAHLSPVVARGAGAETRGAGFAPVRPQKADVARRAADSMASARVFVAELRAGLLVVPDPDEAHSQLKVVLDDIREDPKLSEPCRERLESRLGSDLFAVETVGPAIKDLHAEWQALKADLRIHLGLWRFE